MVIMEGRCRTRQRTCSRICIPMEHRPTPSLHQPAGAAAQGDQAADTLVGIFPSRDSLMRMVGTLLAEQDDEWQVSDRRYFSIGSMTKVDALEGGEDPKELLSQIA